MEIVLVILILILGASLYANYNLYKKYETLEETALQNEQFLIAIRNRVMNKISDLKQIDRRGSFEADDEVGHFFKDLKKIVNDIAAFVEIDNDEFDQSTQRVMTARSTITSEF